jgi:type II secretory pathway component GspD/PulD (secretin)
MKYRTRLVTGCAIAAALVAAVAAQDALSKRVSLDLKAMAPADAFGTLASSVGLKAVVDPTVTSPVDILIRNVTARTALTTMCESIGCEWKLEVGTLLVKPPRPRVAAGSASAQGGPAYAVVPKSTSSAEVSRILDLLKRPLPAGMKFENAPLATVSERISQALGASIALSSTDPAMQRLTIDLSGRSLEAGLRELAVSGTGDYRLGLMTKPDSTGKTQSPSIMIKIGKPPAAKK